MHEADEHLSDDARAYGAEALPAASDLRLLQDVVPERRILVQAVLLGGFAVRPRGDLY
jgi:hypothetical protein